MPITKLLAASLALGTGTIAVAQDYLDFGRIPGLPDEPAVQIDLSPTMLGFVMETARSADPAAADVLSGIEGVRVRIYNEIENVADVLEYVNERSAQLERANWQQVVAVHDEGEVRIYMQAEGESVTGLTAMVVGDAEAVFVNVAGSITPQQLAQLMAATGAGNVLASLRNLPTAE